MFNFPSIIDRSNSTLLNSHLNFGKLSTPRIYATASVIDNVLLIAGGVLGGESLIPSNIVDILNIKTTKWSTAHLFKPKYNLFSFVYYNRAIFAAGSIDENHGCKNADFYDYQKNSWSYTENALSIQRRGIASVAYDNIVLFAGGYADKKAFKNVDYFNWTSSSWRYDENLPEAKANFVGGAVNGIAVFAGGDVLDSFFNYPSTALFYSFQSNSWTIHNALSEGRRDMAVVTVGNYVFFAGGMRLDMRPSDRVDVFNSVTSSWELLLLSEKRCLITAVSFDFKAIFAGGVDNKHDSYFLIDVYDTISTIWSTARLSVARYGMAAATTSSLIFFAGGGSDNEIFPNLDSYSVGLIPKSHGTFKLVNDSASQIYRSDNFTIFLVFQLSYLYYNLVFNFINSSWCSLPFYKTEDCSA